MWCFARCLLCAFSAQTAQRTKTKPIECSPGVNTIVFNITSVVQNALAASGQPARTSHNACYVWRPRPAFSRYAVCLMRGGHATPHPGLVRSRYRATAFVFDPLARPARRIRAASAAARLTLRARCAAHPSAPKGAPTKSTAQLKKKTAFLFSRL